MAAGHQWRNPRGSPSSDGSRRFTSDRRRPARKLARGRHENGGRASPSGVEPERCSVHVFVKNKAPCPGVPPGGGELVEQGPQADGRNIAPHGTRPSRSPQCGKWIRAESCGGTFQLGQAASAASPFGGLPVGGAESRAEPGPPLHLGGRAPG